jgi:hypothetical protein
MTTGTIANPLRRLRPPPVAECETTEAAYRRGYVQGASAFLEAAGAEMPADMRKRLRAFLNGPVTRWRLKFTGLVRVPSKARDEIPPRFPDRPLQPPPY